MRKIKSDYKGSTLVILLLTISVIILIGTIALSITFMNFKMKKLNSEVKKVFYLAEAGIDEAYIISKGFVNDAINYAVTKVNEFNKFETQNNENSVDLQCDFLNEATILNNYIIEDDMDVIFIGAFKDFIKGTCRDIYPNDSLIAVLKKNSSYILYKDGYPKIDAKITETKDNFLVEIKSTYVQRNVKKEIAMKYKIDIPEYKSCDDIRAEDIMRIMEWKEER